MNKQKGITLVAVIITVVLLSIITGISVTSGINTYERAKVIEFESYMQMLQKKVDIAVEEGVDYTTLGSQLTETQQERLLNILNSNIRTNDVESNQLRYFSSSDLDTYFDIRDIKDEIIINFENREVISLNGVEKDGVTYHVQAELYQ